VKLLLLSARESYTISSAAAKTGLCLAHWYSRARHMDDSFIVHRCSSRLLYLPSQLGDNTQYTKICLRPWWHCSAAVSQCNCNEYLLGSVIVTTRYTPVFGTFLFVTTRIQWSTSLEHVQECKLSLNCPHFTYPHMSPKRWNWKPKSSLSAPGIEPGPLAHAHERTRGGAANAYWFLCKDTCRLRCSHCRSFPWPSICVLNYGYIDLYVESSVNSDV